jgi:hypothetical protein
MRTRIPATVHLPPRLHAPVLARVTAKNTERAARGLGPLTIARYVFELVERDVAPSEPATSATDDTHCTDTKEENQNTKTLAWDENAAFAEADEILDTQARARKAFAQATHVGVSLHHEVKEPA